MEVDSFKYLSRLVSRYYRLTSVVPELPIPWTPPAGSIGGLRFGLVTSGGLYHRGQEPPFDLEREKREPTWGDPGYRTLPVDMDPAELGVSHWHINTVSVLEDWNIMLPIDHFRELAHEGRIGGLADHAYSFMGYQGMPADHSGWKGDSGPKVARRLLSEEVDCVLLTAA